jgi:hypothetical protein
VQDNLEPNLREVKKNFFRLADLHRTLSAVSRSGVDEQVQAFRERLERLARTAGRKAIFGPAGISEANFSRILGRGKKPIDNPGLFTVKAIADAAGVTVGELLGETATDAFLLRPPLRRLVAKLDDLDLTERTSLEALLALLLEAVRERAVSDVIHSGSRRVAAGREPAAYQDAPEVDDVLMLGNIREPAVPGEAHDETTDEREGRPAPRRSRSGR